MQTEDKSFTSDQCNLSFKMTKDLKRHLPQHGAKKAHSCNQCGYSIIKAANLKKEKTHAGSQWREAFKAFSCTQGKFSCATTGTLKTHMQTHSGESLSAVHSVNTPAKLLPTSTHTSRHIQGWNLSQSVAAVAIPAQQRVAPNYMCGHIQERSLSIAHSANTPAQQREASRHTC